jgi:repressor LexA
MIKTPSTIGQRLKGARKERGFSVAEVARRLGLAAQTVRNHENLDAVALENLRSYAKIYRVNLDWIETGRGDMRVATGPGEVRLMGTVGAGPSVAAIDDLSWNNAVDLVTLPDPKDTFALKVVGDSALPRYHDGDILLVAREPYLQQDLINTYCVIDLKDGRRVVKMLEKVNGAYVLRSQNDTTPLEEKPDILWCYRIKGVLTG